VADHGETVEIEVDGHLVGITNPEKVFFPGCGATKLDLARYYVAVGAGALRGVFERPTVLRRYPNGVGGPSFFQKRVPERRPDWIETATVRFPSGREATELCPVDVAHLVWAANLGCVDLNPWPVRRGDLEHPDELRIDLDPQPGVGFPAVRELALEVGALLSDLGLVGFPKTSGSRGIHINVPIRPEHGFTEVRRAALAAARELERRRPDLATSAWWKEERGERILVDYNQNARDRTVASAYSVRATPDARVSCPLLWSEVGDVEPEQLTIATVPGRFGVVDPAAASEERRYSLEALLELAARDDAAGVPDAPLPPHFAKGEGEPPRVAPSRRRRAPTNDG